MITITDTAQAKIIDVLSLEGPNASLRMFVQGGGCSGFSYGFAIETEQDDSDIEITAEPIKLIVDPASFEMLDGSIVDFKDDLEGARFAITNPQAKSCCGCGTSFSPC
jgi:iron-sulfur cluster insertion protein